ncbi:MAG TPA: hypothetical protein VIV40_23380 [Kofleriaceae bacterium]
MQRPWTKIWFVLLSTAFACSSSSKHETTGNTAPPTTTPGTSAPGACATDGDCRLVADYCTACDCRVLAKGDPEPTCTGPGVKCMADPCMTKTAVCDAGKCTAKAKAP